MLKIVLQARHFKLPKEGLPYPVHFVANSPASEIVLSAFELRSYLMLRRALPSSRVWLTWHKHLKPSELNLNNAGHILLGLPASKGLIGADSETQGLWMHDIFYHAFL